MIIVTSISPGHINSQTEAVNSWRKFGDCYSINSTKETIEGYRGINLVHTENTLEYYVGKPLVNIKTMIEFAKEKEQDLFLINSDIIIHSLPEFKHDGITILSRYDFENSFEDAKLFEAGFDGFFIPKEFLYIFHQSIHGMGMAWWDYWLPMCAINKNIPLYYPEGKHLFHKIHKTQYSFKEWDKLGQFFKWEFNLDVKLTSPQVATNTIKLIKSKLCPQ